MRRLFFFYLLAFAFHSFGGAIDPVATKISSDADKYYPLDKGSLILEFPESGSATTEFESVLRTKGEDLRKMNTTDLKVFGFAVGASFQTIDFESGKVGKFVLPKEVYIWMQKNPFHEEESPSSTYYRSFRLMLSADLEEVKRLIGTRSNESSGDDVNGLAYAGEGTKFKAGKVASPLKPASLTDPDIRFLEQEYKKTNPKFKLEHAFKGVVGSRTFFKINGHFEVPKGGYPVSGSGLVMKAGAQKYLSFKEDLSDPDYPAFLGDFVFGDVIEGTEGVLIREGNRMHDCHRMILFSKDKTEEVALRCDSGGC